MLSLLLQHFPVSPLNPLPHTPHRRHLDAMSGLCGNESSISSKLATEPDLVTSKSVMSNDGDPFDNGANSDSDINCSDDDDKEWVGYSSSSSLSSPYPPSHPNKDEVNIKPTQVFIQPACLRYSKITHSYSPGKLYQLTLLFLLLYCAMIP